MSNLISLILGIFWAGLLMPLLMRAAPTLRLLDAPDARKRHVGLIPVVGGIAMFVAFMMVSAMSGAWAALPKAFYIGALLMLSIGVVDDLKPLPSVPRFMLQGLTLWVVLHYTGNVLADVGQLVSPSVLRLGHFALPFTVFGFLGVLNAVNLIDGLDGLAGGVAFTALLSFLAVLWLMDTAAGSGAHAPLQVAMMGLMGAVVGFLIFNLRTPWRRRAAAFMGDGGSVFLGFALGWFAIYVCSPLAGERHLAPVSAVWILIVPLVDTISCMIRRMLSGKSPMTADRYHLHHLLQALGLSTGKTVALMVLANALGGVVGISVWWFEIPQYWAFATSLILLAVYMGWSAASWRRIKGRDLARQGPAGQLS